MADLERVLKEIVPPGRFAYYRDLISAKLAEAKLIDSHPVYAVRATRDQYLTTAKKECYE
jgi:hypothetical protein